MAALDSSLNIKECEYLLITFLKDDTRSFDVLINLKAEVKWYEINNIYYDINWYGTSYKMNGLFYGPRAKHFAIVFYKEANKLINNENKMLFDLIKGAVCVDCIRFLDKNKEELDIIAFNRINSWDDNEKNSYKVYKEKDDNLHVELNIE